METIVQVDHDGAIRSPRPVAWSGIDMADRFPALVRAMRLLAGLLLGVLCVTGATVDVGIAQASIVTVDSEVATPAGHTDRTPTAALRIRRLARRLRAARRTTVTPRREHLANSLPVHVAWRTAAHAWRGPPALLG